MGRWVRGPVTAGRPLPGQAIASCRVCGGTSTDVTRTRRPGAWQPPLPIEGHAQRSMPPVRLKILRHRVPRETASQVQSVSKTRTSSKSPRDSRSCCPSAWSNTRFRRTQPLLGHRAYLLRDRDGKIAGEMLTTLRRPPESGDPDPCCADQGRGLIRDGQRGFVRGKSPPDARRPPSMVASCLRLDLGRSRRVCHLPVSRSLHHYLGIGIGHSWSMRDLGEFPPISHGWRAGRIARLRTSCAGGVGADLFSPRRCPLAGSCRPLSKGSTCVPGRASTSHISG